MASSSSSLHSASAALPQASFAASSSSQRRSTSIAFRLPLKLKKPLLIHPKGLGFFRDRSIIAKAKLNEVVGQHANDAASSEIKADVPATKQKDGKAGNLSPPSAPLSEEAIAEFMSQVTDLVKLVDSRDIVELQLKQNNCELIIRKKEALPQPPPAPVVMMQAPPTPASLPSAVPQPSPTPGLPAPPSPAPAARSPAPKALKSSHPPLKSPMAGTFYRCPGPGIAPFVKPGDKVKKGQILCIIEAMKLMNEIEADQDGTVLEILVEDGKPVGLGQDKYNLLEKEFISVMLILHNIFDANILS
ncbi:biotin carboxyl carrier protein of acetyl-CoA carboxylase 1, chloroplastic [Canna indica]|uniref:Biotin carboxyl carrier protein of acetyl-CoA carboxylase n=1 Tax=Canna indica TaxID=4628 RepID=A0AAQ3KDH3_9LILI|nr:biotin carboxyl carrier protein of acetyl-CoA carboxylase 1, chloroplastic [Canna indica]